MIRRLRSEEEQKARMENSRAHKRSARYGRRGSGLDVRERKLAAGKERDVFRKKHYPLMDRFSIRRDEARAKRLREQKKRKSLLGKLNLKGLRDKE